jgi:hypothetical protein
MEAHLNWAPPEGEPTSWPAKPTFMGPKGPTRLGHTRARVWGAQGLAPPYLGRRPPWLPWWMAKQALSPLYKVTPRGGRGHTIPTSLEISSSMHLHLSLSSSPSCVAPRRAA